jgi:imidazolonepropionase-like amidohydrolase
VRRLAGKELTHRALDELPAGKTVEHLRSALSLRQGAQLAKMVRWYTPAEVLTMATLQNAELLSLSGLRNPYPGTLGVVESGAIADLLLIDGDPLEDITLLARPESSMLVIMKGGEIVKSQVSA